MHRCPVSATIRTTFTTEPDAESRGVFIRSRPPCVSLLHIGVGVALISPPWFANQLSIMRPRLCRIFVPSRRSLRWGRARMPQGPVERIPGVRDAVVRTRRTRRKRANTSSASLRSSSSRSGSEQNKTPRVSHDGPISLGDRCLVGRAGSTNRGAWSEARLRRMPAVPDCGQEIRKTSSDC
jgi:hypothetical protein